MVGDVGRKDEALAARPLDVGLGAREPVGAAGEERDACAVSAELARDRPADSRARAGDDDDLAQRVILQAARPPATTAPAPSPTAAPWPSASGGSGIRDSGRSPGGPPGP